MYRHRTIACRVEHLERALGEGDPSAVAVDLPDRPDLSLYAGRGWVQVEDGLALAAGRAVKVYEGWVPDEEV